MASLSSPNGQQTALLLAGTAAVLTTALLLLRRRLNKSSAKSSGLSARGDRLCLPALPYMKGVIDAFTDPFDADTNPGGLVLMAVAENKLTWDLLKPRIEQGFTDLPPWTANYGPMQVQLDGNIDALRGGRLF